jgi:hypothetical protein
MKSVDYTYDLTREDRVRIAFRKRRGQIEYFIVQYTALINGRWRSVMRFDTCHGYAHKHTFHLHDKEYIINLTERGDELNEVFTQSEEFIKRNFQIIKENYLNT